MTEDDLIKFKTLYLDKLNDYDNEKLEFIIKELKKYFLNYLNLSIDDLDNFSKFIKKNKKTIKTLKIVKINEFIHLLNEIIEFNDDLLMMRIMDDI